MVTCAWESQVLVVSNSDCEGAHEEPMCLNLPLGGAAGCEESPCGTLTVLYRELGSEVEILAGDYCGVIPAGFSYCEWDAQGQLVLGPASCDCAC